MILNAALQDDLPWDVIIHIEYEGTNAVVTWGMDDGANAPSCGNVRPIDLRRTVDRYDDLVRVLRSCTCSPRGKRSFDIRWRN